VYGGKRESGKRKAETGAACQLAAPGWNPNTRLALEKLIQAGAGQNLPVVLDFDNTIVCGDIGEATLAVLARDGRLTKSNIPKAFCPPFQPLGKAKVTLGNCFDVTEYYEALLAPTAHGANDPSPLANGYVWAVEIMEGLCPLEIVKAARTAFEFSVSASAHPHPRPGPRNRNRNRSSHTFDNEDDKKPYCYSKPRLIEVTPGKTAFPVPFFYEEIVELIAKLLRHRFDVWIVSASNIWSVRWMVSRALNPRLRQFGIENGLRPDHIIGISTLLADRRDRLYKDPGLIRENSGYAALDPKTLNGFRLTSRLHFPVPIYSGKVACVLDQIGRAPWLCVGDSPGDHSMMAFSRHRLWLARLEKPGYQQATVDLMKNVNDGKWLVQPILASNVPGFVSRLDEIAQGLEAASDDVRNSAAILSCLGNLL